VSGHCAYLFYRFGTLQLDISEISEIQPSLVKLKAVVKTVPRMERFISQVCGFVFQRHPSLGTQ
jgi:hypothetical protein